jgi:hypothetical protein
MAHRYLPSVYLHSFKATRDRLVALSALVKECDWVLPDSHKAHIIMVEETMTSLESALQIAESMEEEEAKRAIEQVCSFLNAPRHLTLNDGMILTL